MDYFVGTSRRKLKQATESILAVATPGPLGLVTLRSDAGLVKIEPPGLYTAAVVWSAGGQRSSKSWSFLEASASRAELGGFAEAVRMADTLLEEGYGPARVKTDDRGLVIRLNKLRQGRGETGEPQYLEILQVAEKWGPQLVFEWIRRRDNSAPHRMASYLAKDLAKKASDKAASDLVDESDMPP